MADRKRDSVGFKDIPASPRNRLLIFVLEHRLIGSDEHGLRRPGSHERFGIVDGESINDRVWVRERECFDEVQLGTRSPKRRLVGEVDGVASCLQEALL